MGSEMCIRDRDCLHKICSIQTGALLDLRNSRVRQTGYADGAVQKASVPALLLQSICQMLANATGCNTFLCKQYNFIFQHSIDKFICKGIQLYKFQNVRIL